MCPSQEITTAVVLGAGLAISVVLFLGVWMSDLPTTEALLVSLVLIVLAATLWLFLAGLYKLNEGAFHSPNEGVTRTVAVSEGGD